MRLAVMLAAGLLLGGCQLAESSVEHRSAVEQARLTAELADYAGRLSAMDPPELEAEHDALAGTAGDAGAELRLAMLLLRRGYPGCDTAEARRRLDALAGRADEPEAARDLARLLAYHADQASCQDADRIAVLLVEEQRQRLAAQDEALEASKEVVRTRAAMRVLREQLEALKSLEEQIMRRDAPPGETPQQ